MPITIQEIIASDTLSQVADKINFNFDQILLNGGGPVGPAGPLGPPGPIGGRGERGSEWYEDPNSTATNPNTIIVSPDLLEGDYYLDADGAVWEYNGTVWNITTVNLRGPQGTPGQSQGWGYFGQTPFIGVGETSLYTSPMPNADTPSSGATLTNEAIPTTVLGGVPTSQVPPAILNPQGGFSAAYQINDVMASQLESPKLTLLVHQKDSGTRGIAFMGGGKIAGDKFEQDDLDKLAVISAAVDDGLIMRVPKAATSPTTVSNLLGYTVLTDERGQRYQAGKNIEFITGSTPGGAIDNSDFTINIQGTASPKYQMSISTASASALIEAGAVGTTLGAAKTGNIVIHGKDVKIGGNGDINLTASGDGSFTAGDELQLAGTNSASLNANIITIGNVSNQKITIQANPSGSGSFNSLQLTSGQTQPTFNFGTPPAVLNGSSKIEMRSEESMRIMSLSDGISIQAGFGATSGTLTEVSFGGAINLFAAQTQDTSSTSQGNIEMRYGPFNTSGTEVFTMRGAADGMIFIGDNTNKSILDATSYKPMIGICTTNSGTQDRTQTIRFGRAAAAQGTGVNRYYGGAEIVGPHASQAKGSNTWAIRAGNENEIALHLRGGLDGNGKNPGDVWLYSTHATGTFTQFDDNFADGNVRIWSGQTRPTYVGASFGPPGGTTIGLDMNDEISDFGGPNVRGHTLLYGRASRSSTTGPRPLSGTYISGSDLNQNTPYPENPSSSNEFPPYAGVNIGDALRGRQTFKVFGDYVGDHFTSKFGGVQSGPGGEVQCFLSGGQTFGSNEDDGSGWINNAGTNNADDDIVFQYKYSWSRTGRVVTGAGTVKIAANANGGTSPGSGTTTNLSQKLIQFHTSSVSAASEVTIGPINLPLQVADGAGSMCSTDREPGGSDGGTRLGVAGANISGVVTPNFDYINANTLVTRLMQYNGSVDNSYNAQGPLSNGVVRAGSATSSLGALGASSPRNYMWLKIYPNHQNGNDNGGGTKYGIIPAVHNFTFTYTLNT